MELPGFYFNKEKKKYFPITQQYLNSQKVTKQKVERDTRLNEVEQLRNSNYNKNKVIHGDILNRIFHFSEIKKIVDSNLHHCINNNQLLKANLKYINPLAKAKVILPESIRDLEINRKFTVLKHNSYQLEYLTLDSKRRCYYHKHDIQNGRFKRRDEINRGEELCSDLNGDDKNYSLSCDNASVCRFEGSIYFHYGYEPLGSESHQPKFYRFVKSTGLFPNRKSYKLNIPVPDNEQLRSVAVSLNYLAVAYNDDLFLHYWKAGEKAVFHHSFNSKSHKRRKGTRKPSISSDIISITFTKEGKEEPHKSNGHLLVGFRNGTLLAIPILKNFIDFDRRFYVPLPSSVKSIVSLHECSDGGVIISTVPVNSANSQLLFYIEKLSYKNRNQLNIIRLNTKYSSVTSAKEICVLTENKKLLCYGKIGELNDKESSCGGFDVFLLDSLENKATNKRDEHPEIHPVRTMNDYLKDDIKGRNSKLISLNSIENVQTPFFDCNTKNYDIELEYEVERTESSLTNGSRVAMIFQSDPAVELGAIDEKYMVISVNLV